MIVSIFAGWAQAKDGVADYARHLAGALESKGVTVDKVPLGYYVNENGYYDEVAAMADAADICHVQFNYVYFNGELPYRNRFARFASALSKPFVMTAHEVRVGFLGGVSGFDSAVKGLLFGATLPVWNAWSRSYHKKMYDSARAIIVHTSSQMEAVASLVKDPGKVVLIPHAVPAVTDAARGISKEEAKKAFGFEGKAVLCIPGFVNARKGYECALEAMRALPDGVCLLIAGGRMTESRPDVAYYDRTAGLIRSKKLDNRVKITGYLNEFGISEAFAAADICLAPFSSPAASGALGLCIGYRKSIIASDIPVHKEINERISCLELFRQGDAVELAAKIKSLIGDRARSKALSDAAASYADRFSYGNIAGETLALYEKVLEKGSS